MLECKPVDTPLVQNHDLGEFPNQIPTNKERYQRLEGKLIYLSHTRPDIAYAVRFVSPFMHSPSKDHMSDVVHILQYLKSSPRRGLMLKKTNICLLTPLRMQTGWGTLLENLHQVTSHLWEAIWSLGRVKKRRWWLYPVQKLSLEAWLKDRVSYFG